MTGQEVRRIRNALDLTQWQFAQAVGMTPASVWMVEHNERKLTAEEERAIRKTLNIPKEEGL